MILYRSLSQWRSATIVSNHLGCLGDMTCSSRDSFLFAMVYTSYVKRANRHCGLPSNKSHLGKDLFPLFIKLVLSNKPLFFHQRKILQFVRNRGSGGRSNRLSHNACSLFFFLDLFNAANCSSNNLVSILNKMQFDNARCRTNT